MMHGQSMDLWRDQVEECVQENCSSHLHEAQLEDIEKKEGRKCTGEGTSQIKRAN